MSTTAAVPAPLLQAISQAKFARLLPNSPLPRYTHVPGSGTPHPYRDPRGHSYNQRPMNPKPLQPERWAENRSYLLGLDFFNLGFYWEAHDEWDRLWRSTGAESLVGRFLKEVREPELVGDEAVLASTNAAGGTTAPQILSVVVSRGDYWVSTTGDLATTTEADLSEVAHAALTATGDPDGIRVRVHFKKDATVGVMEDLKKKLDQVGIPAQAVQFMDAPLD